MSEKHKDDGAVRRRESTRRLATARVPAWALVVTLVVVAAGLGVVILQQRMDAVELGPAVAGAEHVEVRLTICNSEVDRRGINPRQAELDLEDVLTDEGAEGARVRVERRDCPDDDDDAAGARR